MKLSFYLSILISLLILTSCKKDEPEVDYREKYVGTYDIEQRTIVTYLATQTTDTIFTSYPSSAVTKSNYEGMLDIQLGSDQLNVQIAEDGTVSYCQREDAGDFTNTGMIFTITNQDCGMGPNGYVSVYRFIGTKQ